MNSAVRRSRAFPRIRAILALLMGVGLVVLSASTPALADSYVPISGAGSTWAFNAVDSWRTNVFKYGLTVNYQDTGSSDGRNQFGAGTTDFAVSEIPYGTTDQGVVEPPPSRPYAYMPIVAGGTSFLYNLHIGNTRVTNLRLSGPTITGIFTGTITQWNDKAIAADNPGLSLPAEQIVPVVRSDGSGATAQFTLWMSKEYASQWNAYCAKAGISANPCGETSEFPVVPGSATIAQSGSVGVTGYVTQPSGEGTIGYDEYSYALNSGFPVAKMLNAAGYYTEATAGNVAVALLNAQINTDKTSPNYLTQILDSVYTNPDPRTYPLSSYSYMILPIGDASGNPVSPMSTDKGKSLGSFVKYFLCDGQAQAPLLGYSPLPINLVQAGFSQITRVPGVDIGTINIASCNNPTFSTNGTNTLATTAPQPQACDKQGPTQCGSGTGGASKTTTAVKSTATATTTSGTKTSAGTTSSGSTKSSGGTSSSSGGSSSTSTAGGSTTSTGTTSAGTSAGADTGGAANTAAQDPTVANDPALGGADSGTTGSTDLASSSSQTAVPTVVAGSSSGLRHALMVFAFLLLVAVVAGPPLLSRTLGRRRS